MNRYNLIAVTSEYWKPSRDYLAAIVNDLKGVVLDGDVVVVSEKAVSTATGNILDESIVKPSLAATLLAKCWMRLWWAYILGPLCRLKRETIRHFKNYPAKEGSRHKQVAIQRCGFLQALLPASEGGIDGSNLPYSYVSLPLKDALSVAEAIRSRLKMELGKSVTVMIVDSDKTYSWRSFHFTPRQKTIKGTHCLMGVAGYFGGRFFKLKKRATPLAVVGAKMGVEEALEIADLADDLRGFGVGRTVWDMAEFFDVPLTGVSWQMLEKTKHKPVVIVKMLCHLRTT